MYESPAVCTMGITESTATIMLKHWTHTSIPVVGSFQSFKNIDAILSVLTLKRDYVVVTKNLLFWLHE